MLFFTPCAFSQEHDNTQMNDHGQITLAPGPNIDGVTYLHGTKLGEKEIQTFHDVEWIDSLSVRQPWREVEPADQQFDFSGFDRGLEEVKKYNAAHPGANRTLQIRAMGGRNCPKWMEDAGVKYYDTTDVMGAQRTITPIHVPSPIDNPEFIKQLRELYSAMREHYKNEPLVNVIHGTWSSGPWAEMFYPQANENQPLPPGATAEKAIAGFVAQVDAVIDEISMHGLVGELPMSGKYPQKEEINITGAVVNRVVERLGKRSPFFYYNTNGWGITTQDVYTVSWGHEVDVNDTLGLVNLSFQALGQNVGRGGWRQGNWLTLIEMAKKYETGYLEIYTPDFMAELETYNIVPALTQTREEAQSQDSKAPGFIGYRPYLKERNRVLYVREGVVRKTWRCGDEPKKIDRLMIADIVPTDTSITYRARTRLTGGEWSEWQAANDVRELPAGNEAEIEATLHTDDGYYTPKIAVIYPDLDPPYDPPVWKTDEGVGVADSRPNFSGKEE